MSKYIVTISVKGCKTRKKADKYYREYIKYIKDIEFFDKKDKVMFEASWTHNTVEIVKVK